MCIVLVKKCSWQTARDAAAGYTLPFMSEVLLRGLHLQSLGFSSRCSLEDCVFKLGCFKEYVYTVMEDMEESSSWRSIAGLNAFWGVDREPLLWLVYTVAAVWGGWIVSKWFATFKSFDLKPLPPGPRKWPIVGSLLQIQRSKVPLHETLAELVPTYGSIFYLRLGSLPCVVISSAEAAELVLKDKDFAHRASETLLHSMRELEFDNEGFLSHYNERLKLLRKLCATDIMTASRIAAYAKDRAEDVHSSVINVTRISKEGGLVNVHDAIRHQGLNMTTHMIFGKRASSAGVDKTLQRYSEVLPEILQLAGTIYWGDLFPALRWLGAIVSRRGQMLRNWRLQMESAFRKIMGEYKHKAANAAHDKQLQQVDDPATFVEVLLSKQKQYSLISDTTIMATIQDLITGGIEGLSKATEWGIVELVRHPEKLKRLQEEIDGVTTRARRVEESDIPNLPYLRACVKEIFRLYPALPFLLPRETEDVTTTLNGYRIPPKSVVLVNAWYIMRDATRYKDPNSFQPERFLGAEHDARHRGLGEGADYHFLPFGAGRRMCVGARLGTVTAQITLGTLVHAFDWQPPPGVEPMDIDISTTGGMSLGLLKPAYFRVSSRLQPGIY